jgi:hypothetical protein
MGIERGTGCCNEDLQVNISTFTPKEMSQKTKEREGKFKLEEHKNNHMHTNNVPFDIYLVF